MIYIHLYVVGFFHTCIKIPTCGNKSWRVTFHKICFFACKFHISTYFHMWPRSLNVLFPQIIGFFSRITENFHIQNVHFHMWMKYVHMWSAIFNMWIRMPRVEKQRRKQKSIKKNIRHVSQYNRIECKSTNHTLKLVEGPLHIIALHNVYLCGHQRCLGVSLPGKK